jgi:hypothetical protein
MNLEDRLASYQRNAKTNPISAPKVCVTESNYPPGLDEHDGGLTIQE